MPMTRRGAPIRGKTHHHPGVSRTGHCAHDHIFERETELPFLSAHFFGEADITEAAKFMDGSARRNPVRLSPFRFDILDRGLPAVTDSDIEALVDQFHFRAHDAAQHDVANPIVERILMRHPVFLDEAALHADLGRGGRHHPSVVGLNATNGYQGIGA